MGRNKRTLILAEDKYGESFFKKLCKKLKDNGLISKQLTFNVKKLPGKCNPKTERILLARENLDDQIIIVADAHGTDKKEVIASLEVHIPKSFKKITHFIIFDYCIEECICKSLGIRYRTDPVTDLDRYLRNTTGEKYEKHMLPSFVNHIDVNVLVNNDNNFKCFLWLLQHSSQKKYHQKRKSTKEFVKHIARRVQQILFE